MSDTLSLPDRAAILVEKRNQVMAVINELKQQNKDFDWAPFHIGVNEAMDMGHNGLRDAWVMLDRLRVLLNAAERLARDK
jgi:hypothetical protein